MNDYKEMYYKVFNAVTDIIDELKAVQQEAEEMYISQCKSEEAHINFEIKAMSDVKRAVIAMT
jgi:hypothetical protein